MTDTLEKVLALCERGNVKSIKTGDLQITFFSKEPGAELKQAGNRFSDPDLEMPEDLLFRSTPIEIEEVPT